MSTNSDDTPDKQTIFGNASDGWGVGGTDGHAFSTPSRSQRKQNDNSQMTSGATFSPVASPKMLHCSNQTRGYTNENITFNRSSSGGSSSSTSNDTITPDRFVDSTPVMHGRSIVVTRHTSPGDSDDAELVIMSPPMTDDVCPICLEDIETANDTSNDMEIDFVRTRCKHTFHKQCLLDAKLQHKSECPCCRSLLTPPPTSAFLHYDTARTTTTVSGTSGSTPYFNADMHYTSSMAGMMAVSRNAIVAASSRGRDAVRRSLQLRHLQQQNQQQQQHQQHQQQS